MDKKLQNRIYYQKNGEKIKKRVKRWVKNNREKSRKYKRKYGKSGKGKKAQMKYDNSEKGKRAKKEYVERMKKECPERRKAIIKKYDNSEKGRKARKKWLKKNEENQREYYRKLAKTPKRKEQHKIQTHKRRAIIKNLKEHFTLSEWEALKEKWDYTCLACGKQPPEIKLSPDHMIPLGRGGKNNIENIQPLCLKCNLRKNKKIIDYRLLVN